MNFNVIWEKHRKFLTQVAGGFAVFMVFLSVASSIQQGAAEERESIIEKNDAVQRRANKLDAKHDRELKLKGRLEERKKQLLSGVSIAENARIRPPAEHSDTKFKRQKEEIYARFTDRADVAGVLRPELGDISFGVNPDLSDEEWNDRYVQLEVVDRFFRVAVDERVHSVSEVAPESIVTEAVPGNDKVVLYRYPVSVSVIADHAAVLRIVEAFQKEGSFVGVEVVSMEPTEVTGRTGLLSAQLTVVGIDLGEPREDLQGGRRSGGFRGRGPRR